MKLIEKIGDWRIYKLVNIKTEFTWRAPEMHEYYIAYDGIHFPKENKSFEKIKLSIYEGMKARGEIET